ncbi:MAG: DUF58 domain-containing protein [Aquihabitans sp.]
MSSLTRAGWSLLMGALAMVIVGRMLGLPELYMLAAIAAAVVAIAQISVRRPPPHLMVEREVRPRRIHLGEPCRVELQIENAGLRRTPVLSLHDPVAGTVGATLSLAPLDPGGHRSAGYRLPTERRGVLRIGPLDARRVDPFGLASRHHQLAGVSDLTILPAIEALDGGSAGGGLDDPIAGLAHHMLGRPGDEDFSSLRPYVVGDDLRRVHWASTARTGELLVRQDDPPWQGHLTVVLDARSNRIDPEAFEMAVSAAASLIHAVALRGDRARLVITDGTDSGLTDARANQELLLEHLAVVDRHQGARLPVPSADRRTRKGRLVLMTGLVKPDDLARIAHLGHRFATTRVVVFHSSESDQGAATAHAVDGVETLHVSPRSPFPVVWARHRSRAGALR